YKQYYCPQSRPITIDKGSINGLRSTDIQTIM
ncbi:MAG: hypothetical protein ACJA13_002038, partial [Paraglaciecola sp.]